MKWVFVFLLFIVCVDYTISGPVDKEGGKTNPEIICRQAFIIGECPHSPFWSYDPSKGKCRESCGNNDNKFVSKQKCESLCKGVFDNNDSDESEEIRIKAFERVDDPNEKEDLLSEI